MDSDDDASMNEDTDLAMMAREWNKISHSRYTDGFRDGSTAGQKEYVQVAFNAGFKQGYLSSFILSKIRGILTALLAYQVSYEGHPITDATVFETHSLLEEVDSLETNSVAEEFLKLSLHQSNPQTCPDDLIQSFSSSTAITQCGLDGSTNVNSEIQSSQTLGDATMTPKLNLDVVNGLAIKEVNQILLQCPPILNSVNRCKSILKSLNWTDEMIDSLL